ncbi:cation-translocating P-type ATPase [Lederbergia panacisoli]|uniref:cation-translocating P-type ATPase n=1 Tax=Lederbergia panacisoli TaxID=1255251 RepID=UPI00214BF58E|nr:cation-translocating P-type ATPase [Lederbergia panacisoli]MCR2822293.1 cation-translocating P-type ATPase [Lederbergia panacisoli]
MSLWYSKSIEDVKKELQTNIEMGLSNQEAEERLRKYGANQFQEGQKPTIWKMLLEQMNSMLIYILIAAAVISGIVGEISDAVIILIVIVLNAVIGIVQESKAEKALEELKKMSTPSAVVKRDGVVKEISSEKVVPGDVIFIDAGRFIPADLRLVETANLQIEESALTGESVPVDKIATSLEQGEIPLGDQRNMAFMSTLSTYGRGIGIAVHTGMETEIGKIAKMLGNQGKESTPLQKKLDELGKILGIGAILVCIIMFFVGYFQGREVLEMFLIAVSLAVAAIPEGLLAIVTIVLAVGVQKMIKHHAIVRKLPAVETLGAVSVICSDKTGTLTQNKMTVTKVYVGGKFTELANIHIKSEVALQFIKGMMLCNDAVVNDDKQAGDPTEIALVAAGMYTGLTKKELEDQHKRVYEIPFDSDRKMMTTVHENGNQLFSITKGALDRLLPRMTSIFIDGSIKPMTEEDKNGIIAISNQMSEEALRVLAVAKRDISSEKEFNHQLEENLTFLGIVGMIDPPREEVKASIAECKDAGIRTVMITGDHQNTALAIAQDLGIASSISETMTGQQLNEISDVELQEKVEKTRVFARVSPEHKVRIVKALRENGHITSMTGDGVNDAPSLKQADVGVAMGITGTDVAKGAADIVLTDDNFSTIVAAVEQGRNIFQNIKKSILFLLSCNLGEITAIFIGVLLGMPTPLTAVQILWVNLITDTFPAIALGMDPDDPDVMKEKPRNPKESIFAKGSGTFALLNGFLIGFITLFAFVEGLRFYSGASSIFTIDFGNITNDALTHAQTMAFITLSVSQLFHSLNLRSQKKSIFQIGLFTNKYLIGAIVLGIAIQAALVYIPFLHDVFGIHVLTGKDWLFVVGISLIPIIANELVKAGRRIFDK